MRRGSGISRSGVPAARAAETRRTIRHAEVENSHRADVHRGSARLLPLPVQRMKPRLRIEFVGQYVKVSEAKVKGYPQGGLDAGRCGGKYLPRDRA